MTSASELFYSRRYRIGRKTPDLGFGFNLDRDLHHHHHNNRHHRHDPDDCDPVRRPPHIRHPSHRVSQTERESVRLSHGTSQTGTGNSINAETSSSITTRPTFARNHRLPGAVLLARERLLERLRGVSFSGNRLPFDLWDRQGSGTSSGISWNEFALSDDIRHIDAGDWETETPREWLASGIPFTDSTSQTDLLSSLQDLNKKKPPGLSQEDVNCLHHEVFSNTRKGDEMVMSIKAQECSICLERFQDGDWLTCLPCGHRFHSTCLDPWVQTCGDCPYCRTGIIIDNHKARKTDIVFS
ncbi:hypothetical protein HHK36_031000 [Tetracentron sinense]|uniref:RING-type domain-containing protein n=1 Tax=Tetracentron sinense TaxID=13715 RepID=A0A834Y8M1_TETSI|nr:hypothetical protein HHK36_031000 [Tetracentron sinense]